MALPPWYEQARLLYAAIDEASFDLKRPIDRVELVGNQILFRAGTKTLTITYRYVDNRIPGPASFQLDGAHDERAQDPKDRPAWYMRSILLCAAIRRATYDFKEPVDGAEVTAGKVTCWSGQKRQTMRYRSIANPGLPGWFGPRRLFLDDEEIIA